MPILQKSKSWGLIQGKLHSGIRIQHLARQKTHLFQKARKMGNPCFSGIGISTKTAIGFWLMAIGWFQSLFFWNRYFDRRIFLLSVDCKKVSILVFLESVFRPVELRSEFPDVCPFQSLFFWNRYFDITNVAGRIRPNSCFNPCFSGIGISTWFDQSLYSADCEFQSLFFWNRYFDPAVHEDSVWQGAVFQSLFFWNRYFDIRYIRYII